MTTHSKFEAAIRQRVRGAINYGTARIGDFNTVGDLQQFSMGYRHAAPSQYAHLARAFAIAVPPGYEAAP
jgi:hypothetical protein